MICPTASPRSRKRRPSGCCWSPIRTVPERTRAAEPRPRRVDQRHRSATGIAVCPLAVDRVSGHGQLAPGSGTGVPVRPRGVCTVRFDSVGTRCRAGETVTGIEVRCFAAAAADATGVKKETVALAPSVLGTLKTPNRPARRRDGAGAVGGRFPRWPLSSSNPNSPAKSTVPPGRWPTRCRPSPAASRTGIVVGRYGRGSGFLRHCRCSTRQSWDAIVVATATGCARYNPIPGGLTR